MKITLSQLRKMILESWGDAARPASQDELEYYERLQSIQRNRQPGQNVEQRMEKLEAKVDAILDMLGEM
mgnify:CR=1 FL=1